VKVEANFIATAANQIRSALKASATVQGVDLELETSDSGDTNINAQMDNVIDGLKLSLGTSVGAGNKLNDLSSPKISAEYSTGAINAGVSKSGDNVDLSATYAVNDDMSAGVSTSYDTASGSLGDINLAAAYRAGASSVSAVINGLKGDNVGITAQHTVNDNLNVAGHFSTADSKFSLAAGYKIDGDSLVKVNANSDGLVNVGYDRQISENTSLNAGMEIDANDSSARKIGVSMTCTV
jgi:lipopolysaccharide assembly outer membrane protein LptD (OstA)